MARERGRDAILVVRQRDLIGHLLELGAGIAHRDAAARESSMLMSFCASPKAMTSLRSMPRRSQTRASELDLLTPLTVAS